MRPIKTSPPNFSFFDDPDVPFGPCGPLAPPEPADPPGLPPKRPPAPSPDGDKERVGTGNTSRERLPRRPSPPEPQLFPIPMNDGDDDHHKKKDNGDGLDRVNEYTLTHKCHRNHKFNLWLLQNLMICQMRIIQI